MTKYDLRQWKKKDEMTAAHNIAKAKFKKWRTRIFYAVAHADRDDATLAPKELLIEMLADSIQLWDSGLKGSLAECIELYDLVWAYMCDLFFDVAGTDILVGDMYTKMANPIEDRATKTVNDISDEFIGRGDTDENA